MGDNKESTYLFIYLFIYFAEWPVSNPHGSAGRPHGLRQTASTVQRRD